MLTSIYSAEIEDWNNAKIETGNEKDPNESKEFSTNTLLDIHKDIFKEPSAKMEYPDCF